MILRTCGTALILTSLSLASTALGQQYYLYSPKTASAEAKVNKAEGEILVNEIVIKNGDTLSGLSRKFSGKGSYYPQILLFNDIKNPNLIRAGALIRVPMKKGFAGSTDTVSIHKSSAKVQKNKVATEKSVATSTPIAELAITSQSPKVNKVAPVAQVAGNQNLFDQAFKAYSSGDCRAAIDKFDRILTDSPDSPLAADAALYKADCLLKLSAQ